MERHWATGWPEIDDDAGGLRHGAVTELCGQASCGRFFLERLLSSVRQRGGFAGLVDCAHAFDPGSYDASLLSRLLMVFCASAEQGVKAVDLLLRDGNLGVLLLDLQALAPRQIGRIPASTWHRFQRLVENSGTALVVLTPQPIVESARIRIVLRGQWELMELKRPRQELLPEVAVQIFRRGRQAAPIPEEVRAQTA